MACERAKRVEAIRAEMARMREELSGCDWCCGGGDEHWADLIGELAELEPQPDAPAS
jgi:hypothetical protein